VSAAPILHLPLQEVPRMRKLTLNIDTLEVDSFETDIVIGPSRPTTMKTYEPGCTLPELCGTTP
jgi:hypothetical protein